MLRRKLLAVCLAFSAICSSVQMPAEVKAEETQAAEAAEESLSPAEGRKIVFDTTKREV